MNLSKLLIPVTVMLITPFAQHAIAQDIHGRVECAGCTEWWHATGPADVVLTVNGVERCVGPCGLYVSSAPGGNSVSFADFAGNDWLAFHGLSATEPPHTYTRYGDGTVDVPGLGPVNLSGHLLTSLTHGPLFYEFTLSDPLSADFDRDGAVDVGDLFSFIGCYFAGDARADVNGDGAVTVGDVHAYLAEWFR